MLELNELGQDVLVQPVLLLRNHNFYFGFVFLCLAFKRFELGRKIVYYLFQKSLLILEMCKFD